MSQAKVVVIRGKGVFASTGELDQAKVRLMLERGIQLLTGENSPKNGAAQLFSTRDRVGIKINTIAGRKLSTRPELSLSLASILTAGGILNRNIIIWDRSNRELREAGYRLEPSSSGLRIFGTDTQGAGYEPELISHLNIGSRFSTIQTNFITASVSLAVLKDHGLAGVTAGMKNYYGAIHNPNKYHDTNCNPYIAELFATAAIKTKHRLTIIDGLIVQFHRGPSFHSRWAEACGILIFGTDPVATDTVGRQWIEKLRSQKGLPSLKEERREPLYLKTAEKMGLGTASPERIQVTEEEV